MGKTIKGMTSAEYQRRKLYKKRQSEYEEELIPCLECNLKFRRVGSHVVQVHGYESVLEYRQEHGLMAKETRTPEYARVMRKKARNLDNLEKGAHRRFVKGGGHAEYLHEFWENRKNKSDYKKLNSDLKGNK